MSDFERLLKKRTTERVRKLYPYIGAKIRTRRRELRFTLEDVATGICSVSYLSKIENTKIDVKEEILEKILTKLQMDLAVIDTQMQLIIFMNLIKAILTENTDELYNCLGVLKKDTESHLIIIYKMLSAGLKKNALEVKKNYLKILSIENVFTVSEIYLISILALFSAYKANNIEVIEFINKGIGYNLRCEHIEVIKLLSILRANIYLRLCDFAQAYIEIEKVKDFLIDYKLYNVLERLRNELDVRRVIAGYQPIYNTNDLEVKFIINIFKAMKNEDLTIIEEFDNYNTKIANFFKVIFLEKFDKKFDQYLIKNRCLEEKYEVINVLALSRGDKTIYENALFELFKSVLKTGDKQLIFFVGKRIVRDLKAKSKYKDCINYIKKMFPAIVD